MRATWPFVRTSRVQWSSSHLVTYEYTFDLNRAAMLHLATLRRRGLVLGACMGRVTWRLVRMSRLRWSVDLPWRVLVDDGADVPRHRCRVA